MIFCLKDLLLKNRSYRRFDQAVPIPAADLRDMLAHVRFTPSPANLQPLQFIIVHQPGLNHQLFQLLKWAAYLTDWPGPGEGERPAAYIVMLGNRQVSSHITWDYGIALQTILLSAVEKGWGGCAIASCDKSAIQVLLDIPAHLEIACVIALGKPRETIVIDDVKDNNIKYWRDDQLIHHVPKRCLEDLILNTFD